MIYDRIAGLIADRDTGISGRSQQGALARQLTFPEMNASIYDADLTLHTVARKGTVTFKPHPELNSYQWPSSKRTEHTILKHFIMCANGKSK